MIILNPFDEKTLKEFSTLSIISGILFIIAGFIAILHPAVGSISFVWLLAGLFIVVGIFKGYLSFKAHRKSAGAWFKTFGLIISGLLLFVFPVIGAATIAILLSFYFFFDGFSSVYMGYELKPFKGWWLELFNGFLSVLLGVLMIVGWPYSSILTVGIIVGISFIFDGIAMIFIGYMSKKVI